MDLRTRLAAALQDGSRRIPVAAAVLALGITVPLGLATWIVFEGSFWDILGWAPLLAGALAGYWAQDRADIDGGAAGRHAALYGALPALLHFSVWAGLAASVTSSYPIWATIVFGGAIVGALALVCLVTAAIGHIAAGVGDWIARETGKPELPIPYGGHWQR